MKLSVVIVNYNVKYYLEQCLCFEAACPHHGSYSVLYP